MATKLYIAVNGTCTAGPDEDLYQMFEEFEAGTRQRKFSKKLSRMERGGGTVLWIRDEEGVFMIDSGDYDTWDILTKSLHTIAKEEHVDPFRAVKAIYHGHSDPDHVGNNDLFSNAYWLIPNNDELVDICLGQENNQAYNNFRRLYEGHRERGITPDKFTRYSNNEHPGKPEGLTILDAPGHTKGNKAFIIEDDEVVLTNLETGNQILTDRVVFAGDSICDERYLERALSQDPEVQKTAVYGNVIPTDVGRFNGQEERDRLDALNVASNLRIIEEAKKSGVILFGHGGEYLI